MPRAVSLMEDAQRGNMAELQWLYAAETGIEATDADLMVIIERTLSGIGALDWQIMTASEDALGFDRVLADEQAAFLRESYTQCANLDAALEHLAMARFRGFSHLQPWIKDDWTLDRLEPLNQWNMLRNGTADEWAWNPRADATGYASMPPEFRLTPDDYILLNNRRPVNRIGLIKYVRANVAEKDWDGFVEMYGLPPCFIIMPEAVPDGKENEYAEMAQQATDAGSGALPAGSDVKTLSDVRGTQPFQSRLEWLQKQLVLAGTGGILTMLSAPGAGTLAGGAHSSTWNEIVLNLAYKVTRPLHSQYETRALAARFPGRRKLAWIELRATQEKSVEDSINSIVKLAGAGYEVDAEQVERETGYKVRRMSNNQHGMSNVQVGATAAFKAAEAPGSAELVMLQLAEKILDGSVPFGEAVSVAQDILRKLTPEMFDAGDLEKQLAEAMVKFAVAATS